MPEGTPRVLITAEQIAARIDEMAAEIREWYGPDDTITLLGVLKGSWIFMADLARALEGKVIVEFLGVASYEGTRSTGEVRVTHDVRAPLDGSHVVIVEDIIDTGLTLNYLVAALKVRGPASVRIVTLLDKPAHRAVPVPVDLVGFEIPDAFVVGYGLDYNELYRNLPYVGVFE